MEKVNKDKIYQALQRDTVPLEKMLSLETTHIVNGSKMYAPMNVAPGVQLGPYTRDEATMVFGGTGVPKAYYNQLVRLANNNYNLELNTRNDVTHTLATTLLNSDGSLNFNEHRTLKQSLSSVSAATPSGNVRKAEYFS